MKNINPRSRSGQRIADSNFNRALAPATADQTPAMKGISLGASLAPRLLAMALMAVIGIALATKAQAGFGADSGPGFIITWDGSTATVTATGQPPYDGIEDTWIQVVNNGPTPLASLTLTSVSGGIPAFAFDGDGLTTFGATPDPNDNTGYGVLGAYFINISADFATGTVVFDG